MVVAKADVVSKRKEMLTEEKGICQKIERITEKLLTLLGESGAHFRVNKGEKGEWRVAIESVNPGVLIGFRGGRLEAFQLILKLILARESKQWLPVVVDVNDYRAKQEARIVNLAQKAAAEVRLTKRPISLLPMSSYERRLVHIFLGQDGDLETISEGEGSQRRVIIRPKRKVNH